MIRRLTALLLLALLAGPPAAQADPENRCELSGVVTKGGKPTTARIEARLIWKPPVGVHALDPSGYRDSLRQWLDIPSSLTSPTAIADVKKDGAFLLRGLDLGTYELRTVSGGRSVTLTHVHLPAVGVRKRMVLAVAPGEHVLSGKALRADGTPFQGWVMVTQPQYGHDSDPLCRGVPAAPVADDGSFEIQGLESGEARVLLVGPGRLRAEGLRLQLPQSKPIRVVVPNAVRRLTARVVSQGDEKPVAGARIFCRKDVDKELIDLRGASADAEGKFSILAPNDATWMHASAEGFEPKWVTLSEGIPSTIFLRRFGSVCGRVVASDGGKPVAAALVHALPRERAGNAPAMHAITAGDGTFTLRGVPSGETMVFVLGGGFASPRLADVREKGYNPWLVQVHPGHNTSVELPAEPTARATGRIRSAEGDPARGALVFPRPEGLPWHQDGVVRWLPDLVEKGVSKEDGTFTLITMLPGERYVLVGRTWGAAECFSPPAHFEKSEHVRLRLEAPHPRWLDVHVRDEKGSPVRGSEVLVKYHWSRGGLWLPLDARSNSEGNLRLGPLPPGVLEVYGRAVGYLEQGWKEVAAERGVKNRDPYVLTVPGPKWIRGHVVAPDGQSLATVRVEYQDPWTSLWWALTCGEDGAFAVPAHPGRAYTVRARASFERQTWAASESGEPGSTGLILKLAPVPERGESSPPNAAAEDRPEASESGPAWTVRIRSTDGAAVAAGRATIHEIAAQGQQGGGIRGAGFSGEAIEYEPKSRGSTIFVEVFDMVGTDGTPIPGAGFLGPIVGTPRDVRLDLTRGREIQGKVLDDQGEPVRGAVVGAQPVYPIQTMQTAGRVHGRAYTGADGAFTLSGLPLDRYSLVVEAGSSYSKPEPLPHELDTGTVIVRLRRFEPVRIRVLLPDGTPLVGAPVRVGNEEMTNRGPLPWSTVERKTDISGDAFFTGLNGNEKQGLRIDVGIPSPWSGRRTMERPDLLPFFEEKWLPKDTTIRLSRAYEITGRIEAKADLKDLVVCYRKLGEADHASAEVGADGSFRIRQLGEGEYELWTQRGYGFLGGDVPEGPKLKIRSGAKDVRLAQPRK